MSTKVFELIADAVTWQALYLTDDPSKRTRDFDSFNMNGRSKAGGWIRPTTYVLEPLKPRPDFAMIYSPCGGFAVQQRVFEDIEVASQLESPVAELLPVICEDGSEWLWVNVVQCLNVLDHSKSNLDPFHYKFAFRPERFTDSSIFKVPEVASTHIFCWETDDGEMPGFRRFVEDRKLTGLQFEEVWSD